MILLREIQDKDLPALERFAQIPGLFNLPDDRDQLKQRIHKSQQSFLGKVKDRSETKYIFVAEDTDAGEVIATAMIAGQHGTEGAPHFYFQVGSEEKFSKTISTGFIHGTLDLKWDTDGPSEVGGLVVDAGVRNTEERVGRQISFVRFLFLGLNRQLFKNRLIAELLPPLNKRGQSPLWEAIGRRFTNMDYWEADRLCGQNKEFILSLFPTGKVYTTFLSAEARHAIGKVGGQTTPVFHMLTKIGFKYQDQVDPFDGGPHLWVNIDDLKPLKGISEYTLASPETAALEGGQEGLLCPAKQGLGRFRAVSVRALVKAGALVVLGAEADIKLAALELREGARAVFMPYY
ncbi:MAG: arginine N-succinyltransferase [Bdellovibrionales bacterium]|nr:arginine N-succinyltransferase [Bdellovibrionales bacterium]